MSVPVTIVVLARYNDIFLPFVESVKRYCPNHSVVLVRDGNEVSSVPGWNVIQGPARFSIARNGNIGFRAVNPENDILYCGDDIRFREPNTVETLSEIAHSVERIGILSPKLIGRGSITQLAPGSELTFCAAIDMWFPCVYIKRAVINRIGFLDEQFDKFGSDDLDYCIRCVLSGFALAVSSKVVVDHESGPDDSPTTFVRTLGYGEWEKQRLSSVEKIRDKYALTNETFARLLEGEDCDGEPELAMNLVRNNPLRALQGKM